ncbi:hypothetical protein ABH924_005037 [Arthrobacter sp. GAS37]
MAPNEVELATVMFIATAETPVAGMPPWPVTLTLMVWLGPTGPDTPPVPLRVSSCRTGVWAENAPGVVAAPPR